MSLAKPSSITWSTLPKDLQALTILLALGSVAAIAWSWWDISNKFPWQFRWGQWWGLTAVAMCTVPLVRSVPYGRVSFEDPILMAIAIMHGTSGCVIASACFAAFTLLWPLLARVKPPLFIVPFHFGIVSAAFLYGSVYHLLIATHARLSAQIVPAALMAATGFLFTTLVAAKGASWQAGERMWPFWGRVHLPLLVNSIIAAGCALVIANSGPWGVLAYAPAFALIWLWTKRYSRSITAKTANLEAQKPSSASGEHD